MIPEVQVTEPLGTLATLVGVSVRIEGGGSIFRGMGFKRKPPPVPDDGTEEVSVLQ